MTGSAQPDPAVLLAAVADALSRCERAGIAVQLVHDSILTEQGYVLSVGDPRLGTRWQARPRLRGAQTPPEDRHGED